VRRKSKPCSNGSIAGRKGLGRLSRRRCYDLLADGLFVPKPSHRAIGLAHLAADLKGVVRRSPLMFGLGRWHRHSVSRSPFGGRRDLPAAGRRRLQLAASDRSFPVTTARSGTPQRFSRPGRCYRSRGTLAARTAVICSHTLLSSRAYPASLRMLAVLDARIACEGEVPWGAVGEYGAGICVGESVAQCCAGPGRVFLQVGQDYPERA